MTRRQSPRRSNREDASIDPLNRVIGRQAKREGRSEMPDGKQALSDHLLFIHSLIIGHFAREEKALGFFR